MHFYIFIFIGGNKKCRSRRTRRTRKSWAAYEKRRGARKSEENGHVSDTLAWESRIADRELPICRTIASLALTSPFILTPGRLLSREWGSLILLPRQERTYRRIAWLQSRHTTDEKIILSGKSNGNRGRERVRFVLPLFLFQENRETYLRAPIAIPYDRTFPINVRKYYVYDQSA